MRFPVSVLGVTVVLMLAGAASGCGGSSSASPGPKSYYLALGDSIAYGQQPTKPPGTPASAFDTGYVDVFAARLRKLSPDLKVVNYGCSGESTVTFTKGGCPAFAAGFKLHDSFRGTQLRAAQSFLRAHDGDVSPITLTLWGNDWLPLLLDSCKGDLGCVRAQGPPLIASIGARLTSILKRLRAAAPDAEIIVTGAWNPDPRQLTELEPVYRSLNAAIAGAASRSDARVAKARLVFNPPGTVQKQQSRLCAFTFICSQGDPHPTDAGYRALAAAFMAASGYAQEG
jgi:lysophospholipase L1-like esterase